MITVYDTKKHLQIIQSDLGMTDDYVEEKMKYI